MKRKKILIIGAVVVLVITIIAVGTVVILQNKKKPSNVAANNVPVKEDQAPTTAPASTSSETPKPVQPTPPTTPAKPVAATWPVQISASDATSLTVVVNKKHQLPSSYVPAGLTAYGGYQLRSEAANALTRLVSDAAANGYSLKLISGYRSYSSQQSVYNSYVSRDGQLAADTYSARPGFSEHQTGLAADVGNGTCDLEICFGDTAAGLWIAAHAQDYGFIVRYPKGKEADTGYQYEPWHLRFLGTDIAKAVYSSGKTLDQYYNVPAGGYE